MRAPLTFAWRNVVFGQDLDDAWALFRVQTHSYAGLPTARKCEVLGAAGRLGVRLLRRTSSCCACTSRGRRGPTRRRPTRCGTIVTVATTASRR